VAQSVRWSPPWTRRHGFAVAAGCVCGILGAFSASAEVLERWHFEDIQKQYINETRARLGRVPTDVAARRLARACCKLGEVACAELQPGLSRLLNALQRRAEAVGPETSNDELADLIEAAWLLRESQVAAYAHIADTALPPALRRVTDGSVPQRIAGVTRELLRWAESFPDAEVEQLVNALVEFGPQGGPRARALTVLGQLRRQQGQTHAALQAFAAAIREPPADVGDWMATRAAFMAWAEVEPEAALAAAREHDFGDLWGGPETAIAPIMAAAATAIAATDLPRALSMVREAPETQWSLGGVHNTRAEAMLSLAQHIAPQHPAGAEALIRDVMAGRYFVDCCTLLSSIAALPAEVGRPILADYLAGVAVGGWDHDRHLAVGQIDPAQLRRLASRWEELRREVGGAGREHFPLFDPTLSALASGMMGLDVLNERVAEAALSETGKPIIQSRLRWDDWHQLEMLLDWLRLVNLILEAEFD
jgi:hypothetical protein